MARFIRFYAMRVEQNICKFGNEMCCMQIPFDNNKHENNFAHHCRQALSVIGRRQRRRGLAAVHKVNGPAIKLKFVKTEKRIRINIIAIIIIYSVRNAGRWPNGRPNTIRILTHACVHRLRRHASG